ncbi:MAG: excinuclease ABC subunit UvrC [Candidatus Komeilibacteria bacterium]
MDKIKKILQQLPAKPGVYRFFSDQNKLLYIGKAKNLRQRVRSYFQNSSELTPAKQQMIKQVKRITYTIVTNETEALLLERTQIRKHQPPYNIDLKDDKRFVYILLDLKTDEPMIAVTRQFQPDKNRHYFGPYTSAGAARHIVRLVEKIWLKKIGDYKLIDFSPAQYKTIGQNIKNFLQGKTSAVTKELSIRMKKSAAAHNYELAAHYRDQLQAIEHLHIKQNIITRQTRAEDIFSLYEQEDKIYVNLFKLRQGKLWEQQLFNFNRRPALSSDDMLTQFIQSYYEKSSDRPAIIICQYPLKGEFIAPILVPQRGARQRLIQLGINNAADLARKNKAPWAKQTDNRVPALDQLQKALQLNNTPQRIETYDISNIQGRFAVGSMIVFIDGKAAPHHYKRFRIKTISSSDDPRMMQEMLARRWQHQDWPQPDLIVLDGGPTQWSAIQKLPISKKYKIVALAKREEKIYINSKTIIKLPFNTPAFFLMQRMRDEAHRFAINYYRQTHRSTSLASRLDNIKGIGPITKKRLKQNYSSWQEINQAKKEDLIKLIGSAKAHLIIDSCK